MGLDMYLEKHTYIWEDGRKDLRIEGPGTQAIKTERVKTIVEEVGYWRKANAIHAWFVENVQDGEDNCQSSYVGREKIEELLALVNRVLDASELVEGNVTNGFTFKNGEMVPIVEQGRTIKDAKVAHELLPTRSGFFFGNTDYNQYYFDDLEATKEICESVLAEEEGNASLYYRASW